MEQAALSEDELYYTDMPLGEILRRTREYYGQSILDIERAICIRAVQIESIESGKVENLPGRVYAIGFVRAYAEYLGLDGERMVHLFKTQDVGKTEDPELAFPVIASETKIPPMWLVGLSLVVSALIIIAWWMIHNSDRAFVKQIPPIPVEMKVESLHKEGEIYGPPMPSEEEKASIKEIFKNEIILNIEQNTWVEIKDKTGKVLVSQVLKADDKYYVPNRPDLLMSLGNAGGVILEVDGQQLSPIGNLGAVRRHIPLDAEYLKNNYAIKPE
ncbi:MAG: DUF4115 domain-containing protein [Alphaproteobacteria bacterium]|nr:DUF4115 domain-containing protein [Alphaproteobacteria bacterium]